jgi:hypothetical protein
MVCEGRESGVASMDTEVDVTSLGQRGRMLVSENGFARECGDTRTSNEGRPHSETTLYSPMQSRGRTEELYQCPGGAENWVHVV